MENKKCKMCNIEKPIDNYRLMKNGYYQCYCKKCEIIYQKNLREKNNNNYLKYQKIYRDNHKEYKKEYEKQRYATKDTYRLYKKLNCYIRNILNKKGNTKVEYKNYFGISSFDLYKHLVNSYEKRYNEPFIYSSKIHIDHIIPLCEAKNVEEVYKLYWYTNLQLLKDIDNYKKGRKRN